MINGVLPAGITDLHDFTEYNAAAQTAGLIGAGSDKTFLVLRGPIKTKPLITNTNPYYALMAGNPQKPLNAPIFRGFTIVLQGNWPFSFGGFRVTANQPLIEDIRIIGGPGESNTPPGETFGLNLWHCADPIVRDVEIDGESVGAAGFSGNSSSNLRFDNCEAHDLGHSHGFTMWSCDRAIYSHCRAYSNGKGTGSSGGVGFNWEQHLKSGEGSYHVGSIAEDNTLGSFRFVDDTISSKHKIASSLGTGPILVYKKQQRADVDTTGSVLL